MRRSSLEGYKVTYNNNNNNIVICKAHKVSSNAEMEAPAVARWTALAGYAKRTVETNLYGLYDP